MQTETGVADCVEHIRCEAVRKKIEKNALVRVIKLITEYGVSAVSEVHSYLIGASCNWFEMQQGRVILALKHSAAGDGGLAIGTDPFLDANSTAARFADGGVDFVLLP